MRNRRNLTWIVCLILAVICLSTCSLFGWGKSTDTAAPNQTVEPGAEVSSTSEPASDNSESEKEGKINNTTDASTDAQMPEIEIPDAPDPTNTQPKQTMMPEQESESIPKPEKEPESTPTPDQESGNSDMTVDENGDILLPEIP